MSGQGVERQGGVRSLALPDGHEERRIALPDGRGLGYREYGDPRGYLPFRETVARVLASRGVDARA